MTFECSMTGNVFTDTADGIYDDGEWISWDWINGQIHEQSLREKFPKSSPEVAHILEDLIFTAQDYYQITGRYLQIWGELGELYAEVKYGIKRHKPHTAGSDGKLGNDFVEVKTISPEKDMPEILVKRAGNFNKILLVKINNEFKFESRLVNRKALPKGDGRNVRITWGKATNLDINDVPDNIFEEDW